MADIELENSGFELPANCGVVNWLFTYTEDGANWHTHIFEFYEAAQRFALAVCDANQHNSVFECYAQTASIVDTATFLTCTEASATRATAKTATAMASSSERLW